MIQMVMDLKKKNRDLNQYDLMSSLMWIKTMTHARAHTHLFYGSRHIMHSVDLGRMLGTVVHSYNLSF